MLQICSVTLEVFIVWGLTTLIKGTYHWDKELQLHSEASSI